MSRRIAFPFLTIGDAAIAAQPWFVAAGEGELHPAVDQLPDWDYASRIRIHRKIGLDLARVATDLEIGSDELSLSAVARIGTGQGRIPRRIVASVRKSLMPGESQFVFDIEVPGHELSAVLDLRVDLLVEIVPEHAGPLSPADRFDRIWQEVTRIRLEGEEPRFPIEIIDLADMLGSGTPSHAPWYLHWSPADWSRDFHGVVRLYLNRRCPQFITRIEAEDPETLRALMADVMGQVCERFLAEEDIDALLEVCEPGSLGRQASTWLKQAWPARDPAYVRSILHNRPGRFRAAFLGLAQQLEDSE